jgi:periplasmic protein TonB
VSMPANEKSELTVRRTDASRKNLGAGTVRAASVPQLSSADDRSAARTERLSFPRFGLALVLIALVFGGVAYVFVGHDDMPPPRQVRELTIVNIVPPPPPPPTPPPQMPEQKMIEQPKMAEPEFKEDKPLEKPKDEPVKDAKNDEPPGPLSLDAKATGPGDLFNLGGKPGGNPYGGGGGGSRWGWYSTIVTTQIEAAIRSNPKTRNMTTQIQVKLWADNSGRVSRVVLTPSTGDPEVDAALRNEVIGGLMLREPPPKDMPMPVVTRVTARRPT